ncbi:MAG: glycosyltransferase family 4 protein [Nitrospirae bacterium]|nr:glycosyltransferase family 4 protein [Nitrospirota bacterium]
MSIPQYKVAIITAFDPSVFKGGIETYTIQLINFLIKNNASVDIYHTGMIKEDPGFHNNFIGKLYHLGREMFKFDLEYDVIIANSFYGFGYFPPRVRTLNIFHSTHAAFAEKLLNVIPYSVYLEWKLLCGEFCEATSGFGRLNIAVSESVRDELRDYYNFKDIELIPHGIDTGTFRKLNKQRARRSFGIPEDSFVGLYVGRWDETKGASVLEKVIAADPETFWVLVMGTGSDRNILPASSNILVLEEMDHEKLTQVYSASDFMLFPSRYEAFGYVIIEAMACELPVITTNVGVAKTIYKCEPFRELLLPDFSEGSERLAASALDKIKLLRANEEWRCRIGAESRETVEQQYTIELWQEKMAAVLQLT